MGSNRRSFDRAEAEQAVSILLLGYKSFLKSWLPWDARLNDATIAQIALSEAGQTGPAELAVLVGRFVVAR